MQEERLEENDIFRETGYGNQVLEDLVAHGNREFERRMPEPVFQNKIVKYNPKTKRPRSRVLLGKFEYNDPRRRIVDEDFGKEGSRDVQFERRFRKKGLESENLKMGIPQQGS